MPTLESLEYNTLVICKRRLDRPVNKRKLSRDLLEGAARLCAKMLRDQGLMNSNDLRTSVASKGKAELDRVRRKLHLMANGTFHHSQQASKRADKTIRAIIGNRLTWRLMLAQMDEFGSLRMQGVRVNARNTPFVEAEQLRFKSGMRMELLTTTAAIVHVGRVMENCLAEIDFFGSEYISQARKRVIKLFVLRDSSQFWRAVLCIDPIHNSLLEVKGIRNSRPWKHRPQIIHFLARTGVSCDGCRDAAELALCDALIRAYADGLREKRTVDGVIYETAPDSLVIKRGSDTALLQKNSVASGLSVTVGTDGDAMETRQQLRGWLRDALAKNPGLLAACNAAFGKLDVASKKVWKRGIE